MAYLVERWADEDAAASVGDRDLTAQAVARASLAGRGPALLEAALAMHGGTAVDRVLALSEPRPAPRRRRLLAAVAFSAGCLGAAGMATYGFVELARAWL